MAGWLPLVKSSGLLLDTLSATAVFAVSSRKLRAAYPGKALQIQNGTDIGFDGSGNLDTSGLSGTNSIKIWYDQSGNTNDVSNATTGQQPVIQNSGVLVQQSGHVWAAGTSGTGLLNSMVLAQPYSVAILGKVDAVGIGNSFIGTQFQGNHLGIGSNPGNQWNLSAGGGAVQVAGADINVHTFIYAVAGASSSIIVDGTTLITGNPGTDALAGFDLWDFGSSIHMGEILFFNGVLSAPDIAAIKSSWVSYWGAPP